MKIKATKQQIEEAKKLATIRNSNKKEWQNRRYSNHSDFRIHYIGALAEVVFGDLIGIASDYNQYEKGDEYDFKVCGLTIDIKARMKAHYQIDLAITEDSPEYLKSDIYILAVIDGDIISFEGYATKVMFALLGEQKKLAAMRWLIDKKYLKDVEPLIDKIGTKVLWEITTDNDKLSSVKEIQIRRFKMKTFTAHKVNLDGSLSHKENLGQEELDFWMAEKYGKFATVQIACDQTGQTIIYTDNGEWWDKVS